MKYIIFTATIQNAHGTHTNKIGVMARNINTGFAQAARIATKNLGTAEIVSLEFTEVR